MSAERFSANFGGRSVRQMFEHNQSIVEVSVRLGVSAHIRLKAAYKPLR